MEGNWTDVGTFQQQWPQPDKELANFLRRVQQTKIEHLLTPGEPILITPDITHILHFPERGQYEIIVPYPEKAVGFDIQNPAQRVALYRPYMHRPEIIVGEDGVEMTYHRMLFLSPLGAKGSYLEALRLFGIAPREIQNKTGMFEQAKRIKEKYEKALDDKLTIILDCPLVE